MPESIAHSRFAIASAIALVGCGSGPKRVDVSGTSRDLRFTAVAPAGAGPACVNELSVTPAMPEEADPTWQVVAVAPAKCVVALRYGEATADFAEKAPATPLRSDMTYRVRISGPGFSVVRDFRLTPQGVTVQN